MQKINRFSEVKFTCMQISQINNELTQTQINKTEIWFMHLNFMPLFTVNYFTRNTFEKIITRETICQVICKKFSIRVASPKKLMNPTMSVTVVRIIEEDWAGSCPIAVNIIGITAPENPAIIMEQTIAVPITAANPIESAQK